MFCIDHKMILNPLHNLKSNFARWIGSYYNGAMFCVCYRSRIHSKKTSFIYLWFLLIDGASGCPEFLQAVQDFLRLSNFRKTFGLSQARKYDIATKVSRISDTTLFRLATKNYLYSKLILWICLTI